MELITRILGDVILSSRVRGLNKVIRIYVSSAEIPTTGFVDIEGARHECARAADKAFSGLKNYPSLDGTSRFLSTEEQKAILLVSDFCRKKGYGFEIVDVGTKGFLKRVKLRRKGLTGFPAISYEEKIINGVPTHETLMALLGEP
jgi:hypothetical protein